MFRQAAGVECEGGPNSFMNSVGGRERGRGGGWWWWLGVVVGVAVDGNSVDDATGYFGVNPLSL